MEKKKIFFVLFILIVILAFVLVSFSSCSGKKVKPNILLVTIDTLKTDHVGGYGYPRQTTPFIDSLAKKGVIFRHAFTPLPLTAGSHATILTSLHPLTHGVITNGNSLDHKVQTIAEVLKENGYYTIGAVGVSFLSQRYNFQQGFDSFSDKPGKGYYRNAKEVNKSLLKQIDNYVALKEQKPFFIWVHYYDPHTPYRNRKYTFKREIPRRFLNGYEKNGRVVHRYDTEIRFTDEAVKTLVEYLKKKGLDKQLLTCVTADHGEQHGEHGGWNGHYDFYTETIWVPLLFHGYKIPQGKSIRQWVSTMDIAETLLHTAGLDFRYETEGCDLLKVEEKAPVDPGREFLVVGNPEDIKSIQLIKYPFSYILNFDHHYGYWCLSEKDVVPGEQFKKISKEQISLKQKKFKKVTLNFIDSFREGLYYAGVRVDLEEKNYNKKIRTWFNHRLFNQLVINRKLNHFTVWHPITTMDRLDFKIGCYVAADTKFKEIKYSILSEQEFLKYADQLGRLDNRIVTKLRTNRKESTIDELFDLEKDWAMNKNLLKTKGIIPFKNKIADYKKLLYKRFEFYYMKGKKLLGKVTKKRELTKKELEMLKSLGYL